MNKGIGLIFNLLTNVVKLTSCRDWTSAQINLYRETLEDEGVNCGHMRWREYGPHSGAPGRTYNRLYRIEDCWQEAGADASSTPTGPEGNASPARIPG